MIKINDIQYDDYHIEVTWDNFEVTNKAGEKRSGTAPFITFHLDNGIAIGLESTFSQDMLLNTKENVKTDIKEYISDILFEKDENWRSLSSRNYDCNITRINEKAFHLELNVEDYEINVLLDVDIDLF